MNKPTKKEMTKKKKKNKKERSPFNDFNIAIEGTKRTRMAKQITRVFSLNLGESVLVSLERKYLAGEKILGPTNSLQLNILKKLFSLYFSLPSPFIPPKIYQTKQTLRFLVENNSIGTSSSHHTWMEAKVVG